MDAIAPSLGDNHYETTVSEEDRENDEFMFSADSLYGINVNVLYGAAIRPDAHKGIITMAT